MIRTALALALAAAVLHAGWNLLLAAVPRGPDTTAVASALGLLCWTPLALWRWRFESAAWPYALASVGFELVYFATLNRAYARAPAAAVYPVARGVAPVLLLVATVAGPGRVPLPAALAVLAISAGILLTARSDRGAVRYALPVAVCIAGYTYLDAHALAHADPATYLWVVMAPVAVTLLARSLLTGRRRGTRGPAVTPTALAIGIGIFGAYGLTLAALSLVPAAQVPAVASVRESSILLVVALSWITGPVRPTVPAGLAATLVFAGVAVLAAF